MIYSPGFGLCHTLCRKSLQESSISVYCLWEETCLPQQSARKLLYAASSPWLNCPLVSSLKKTACTCSIHQLDQSQQPPLAEELQLTTGLCSPSDTGVTKEASERQQQSCTPVFLYHSCPHRGGRAQPWRKGHFYQPIHSNPLVQIPNLFFKNWICQAMISLGCFQLGLALKKRWSDKARISCRKTRAQTSTEFAAT